MEWTIVTTIVVLIGLMTAVLTPMLKLNSAITRLNVTVDALAAQLAEYRKEERDARGKLWKAVNAQDDRLNEQDKRLALLEKGLER